VAAIAPLVTAEMCGIAGLVDVTGRPATADLVRAMTAVQQHRGPDGEAIVCRGPVGLGHRRLAIIDLATGDQPMANDDGSIWIVFNGEIYNFRELRRELEARGARFRTNSDTEVILRAYEAEGPACVGRLRGMFAFAILDERARCVFLARDRVGIKPLVYHWDGRRLLFASELKGILQDRRVPRQLDAHALGEYLTHLYVPAPRTIFTAVRKLPPACSLRLSLDGGEPVIARYWKLAFAPDRHVTESEWLERLRDQLREAVRCHLVSDVPLGAFLSGGVDSSSVVAFMAQASSAPIRTFSIGFAEQDFDELQFARQVARRYGTDHYELVVKPSALEVLPQLAWHFDEPFADSSSIPTYYLAKMTREHVTVALSGDGGDENFAGYRRYAQARDLQETFDHSPLTIVRPFLRLASRLLPVGAPGQAYTGLLGADAIERYFRLITYHRPETLRRLVARDLAAIAETVPRPTRFREIAADGGTSDYVSTLQYIDLQTYLPGDILTKVDVASMAVSLEVRVPLLDHVLMEFLATVPASFKLRDRTGKFLLKRAVAPLLPPGILARRKMGFGVPLASWFRSELRDLTRDVLLSQSARERGLFRMPAVEALLDSHASGRRDDSAMLWALVCFELWMRQWATVSDGVRRENS
jgi:asparagine synthase (glutamine-hydrolysing)